MTYEIIIKTLSGIHISKGERIDLGEYWVNNGIYYRLNTDKIYNFIFTEYPDSLNQFNEWINTKVDVASYSNNQTRNADKKMGVFDFVSEKLRNQKLQSLLKDKIINDNFAFYQFPVHKTSNKQINELLKTSNNEVYLPGSSIKGLIKNAVLNKIIFDNIDVDSRLLSIVKNIAAKDPKNMKPNEKKKIGEQLENYIYNCGFKSNRGEKFDDAKYDVFKFIKVSDSNTHLTKDSCYLSELNLLFSHGKKQEQLPSFEIIKEGIEFQSKLQIDVAAIKTVAEKYIAEKYIKDMNSAKEWINFDKVCKNVFEITVKEIMDKNKFQIAEKIKGEIIDSIQNFSTQLINLDFNWWGDKPGYADDLDKYPDNAVKIGFGSGFGATTIYSTLLEKNISVLEHFYNSLLRKNNRNRINGKDFPLKNLPKTRHVEKVNNSYKPFGWISLEIK